MNIYLPVEYRVDKTGDVYEYDPNQNSLRCLGNLGNMSLKEFFRIEDSKPNYMKASYNNSRKCADCSEEIPYNIFTCERCGDDFRDTAQQSQPR